MAALTPPLPPLGSALNYDVAAEIVGGLWLAGWAGLGSASQLGAWRQAGRQAESMRSVNHGKANIAAIQSLELVGIPWISRFFMIVHRICHGFYKETVVLGGAGRS